MPPGDLGMVEQKLRTDQRYLLNRAERLGPVFKCNTRTRLLIVVVGNELARRIFAAHGGGLTSRHKDLDALFPIGHLRSMRGEQHRRYRQMFVRALRPELIAGCDSELLAIASGVIGPLAAEVGEAGVATRRAITALREVTTRMLILLFLGVDPESALGARVRDSYDRLAGGFAPAYAYTGRNLAFEEIREVVHERARDLAQGREGKATVCWRVSWARVRSTIPQ